MAFCEIWEWDTCQIQNGLVVILAASSFTGSYPSRWDELSRLYLSLAKNVQSASHWASEAGWYQLMAFKQHSPACHQDTHTHAQYRLSPKCHKVKLFNVFMSSYAAIISVVTFYFHHYSAFNFHWVAPGLSFPDVAQVFELRLHVLLTYSYWSACTGLLLQVTTAGRAAMCLRDGRIPNPNLNSTL